MPCSGAGFTPAATGSACCLFVYTVESAMALDGHALVQARHFMHTTPMMYFIAPGINNDNA